MARMRSGAPLSIIISLELPSCLTIVAIHLLELLKGTLYTTGDFWRKSVMGCSGSKNYK